MPFGVWDIGGTFGPDLKRSDATACCYGSNSWSSSILCSKRLRSLGPSLLGVLQTWGAARHTLPSEVCISKLPLIVLLFPFENVLGLL